MDSLLLKRQIHLIDGFDGNLLGYDVNSSMVVNLNQIAWEILELDDSFSLGSLKSFCLGRGYSLVDTEETLRDMLGLKLLIEKPIEENSSHCVACGKSEESQKIGGIVLNICHMCNMSCSYCFASGGDYGLGSSIMESDVIKKSLDILFDNLIDGDTIIISLFGGEPFLNWAGMKEAIRYAEKRNESVGKKIVFFITTNGTLLDKRKLSFLRGRDIRFSLSIDGFKEVNDAYRRFKDGSSAFEESISGLKMIIDDGSFSLQIRPTVNALSAGIIPEISQFFEGLGAKRIHFRPMSSKQGTSLSLSENDYIKMAQGFHSLSRRMLSQAKAGTEIVAYINILKFVYILFFRLRRQFYCGAGSTVFSVDPSGQLVPCPRFTGDNDFQLGNISCNGIAADKQKEFKEQSVFTRPNCDFCWARAICAGGCLYMHHSQDTSLSQNYEVWCDFTRSTIEDAIRLFSSLQALSKNHIIDLLKKYPPLISGLEKFTREGR